MAGRINGLIAHAFEEMTQEKPFSRRLSEEEIRYVGPKEKKLK
jgi:citryl-CoA lyase